MFHPDLYLALTRLGVRERLQTQPRAGRGSRCTGLERRLLRNSASPLVPPSLPLSPSLLSRSPFLLSLRCCGRAGGRAGCGGGCAVSSFSLPGPHPPSADASGALASPTPAFAIGSGRRWMVLPRLQHLPGSHAGASYREPRPCARRCRRRQPGRRGSAVSLLSLPGQPHKLAGRSGGGVPAGGWEPWRRPRGSSGVLWSFLLARGSVRIWKTAELAASRPGGRVQPGGTNFDMRAFCKEVAASRCPGVDGGPGAGVGAVGAGGARLTCPTAQSAAPGVWLNLPWNLQH